MYLDRHTRGLMSLSIGMQSTKPSQQKRRRLAVRLMSLHIGMQSTKPGQTKHRRLALHQTFDWQKSLLSGKA